MDGYFYLQQDRSPIHMAQSVAELLKDSGVMVLSGPPKEQT